MGRKGDKLTQDSILVAELLVDKLHTIGAISTKKMFGGHGIFHESKMFGIIDSKGTAFLKADNTSREIYEEKGADKHGKMPYYSIPEAILNNQDILMQWAKKSIEISKNN